jgi:hypothetical protein
MRRLAVDETEAAVIVRHKWHTQFNQQGGKQHHCIRPGCGVIKVSAQVGDKWETQYHMPTGHVSLRHAPPCTGR